MLVGTDAKKLYRHLISSAQNEVLFESTPGSTDGFYIYDIKKDFEGRIAIADSDNIFLLAGEDAKPVDLGSYSSCSPR